MLYLRSSTMFSKYCGVKAKCTYIHYIIVMYFKNKNRVLTHGPYFSLYIFMLQVHELIFLVLWKFAFMEKKFELRCMIYSIVIKMEFSSSANTPQKCDKRLPCCTCSRSVIQLILLLSCHWHCFQEGSGFNDSSSIATSLTSLIYSKLHSTPIWLVLPFLF